LSGVSRQGEKPHSYVEILSVVKNSSTKILPEKSRPLEPLRVVPLPFRKPPFPRPLRFLGNPNFRPSSRNEHGETSSPFTSYAGLDESEGEEALVGSSDGSERPTPFDIGIGCEWTARDRRLQGILAQLVAWVVW